MYVSFFITQVIIYAYMSDRVSASFLYSLNMGEREGLSLVLLGRLELKIENNQDINIAHAYPQLRGSIHRHFYRTLEANMLWTV